ncbi:MAG: ATP-binding protein [Lachnospiraceae bacterium]|nr:ATP-binding protein [Lachnospiraceae bacterium]
MGAKYDENLRSEPFKDYNEYMKYIFDCVNTSMDRYIDGMKTVYANQEGGYKNVLYPDLELAGDMCKTHIERFYTDDGEGADKEEAFFEDAGNDDDYADEEDEFEDDDDDDELLSLLDAFGTGGDDDSDDDGDYGDTDEAPGGIDTAAMSADARLPVRERLSYIEDRARITLEQGISLPFYELCTKLEFEPFTLFCFACGILSSTQTDYAGVFQIVNENGNLSSPTIESAAKVFYGKEYSITGAYGDMSTCLEQLLPLLSLNVMKSMPFSTVVSPDKRVIDCLFGRNPDKLDEDYSRFISMLTDDKELDPILANKGVLDEMKISYDEGVRIFYYFGDEGSGRKFFVKNFCRERGLKAVAIDCKKLFNYDYQFVDRALWAVTRECILTNSCCCLTELSFREEEKEKFFGYMDLAFAKLNEQNILVFSMSKEHIDFRQITKSEFTELELPTPDTGERMECWKYYARDYSLEEGIDMLEMSTKFLFTPGKIHDALKHARSLSTMAQQEVISRDTLFKGCYNQMSSELTQKATKIKANFGFEDIVMNPSQRETLEHAIDQMNFRKQVYENWHYTKKYPYGRGLSILLFGAPGTGKSMCAQVIAHELNLELYRVDLSKVIDKYVGETEKSISMIFREAKKCNVVLFFDECDTLFAKRSDDGGSNQASNNNKTALLLQEVEAYDGVSVLATNYKHNIDPAFFRRMKYIVEFQFPDPDTREMLWTTTIPKDTPLADDVDIRFLAEKFEFVGGNIKNCILNAAFLAAADPEAGGMVHMKHYLLAIKYEFVKVGKVFTKSDFEPYAAEVGLA